MTNQVQVNCNGISVTVSSTTRTTLYRCKDLHIRLAKTYNHIAFLRRCRKHHIVPKGLTPTIPDLPGKKRLQAKFGKVLVQQQINCLYRKKKELQKEELECRSRLQTSTDPTIFSIIWTWILVNEKQVFLHTREIQCRKFDKLYEAGRKATSHHIKQRVFNFSSHTLTQGEISLLEKGLNFVPVQVSKVTSETVCNTELISRRLGNNGQVLVHLTKSYLQSASERTNVNLTREESAALQDLRKRDDLIITEADKGKAVVLLNERDYNNKMMDILNTDGYKQLQNDPTESKEQALKSVLEDIQKRGFMQQKEIKNILKCNTHVPTIYGCPKIHKLNIPLRPVVSTFGTPWSALSKFLIPILNPLAYPQGHKSIRNTKSFVDEVRALSIKGQYLLLSFDVVNLFGSIPVNKCLPLVRELLEQDLSLHLRTNLPISTILELVTECTSNNYFKFNDDFYEQSKGLAMGSPLSPCLASMYMNHIEDEIEKLALFAFVEWFRRYVDDYFYIWTGSRTDLDIFHDHINKIDDDIEFTKEIETDDQLPFLDVLITRRDDKLFTSMYEKPVTSGILLNYASDHPNYVKRNIVQNLTNKVQQCSDDPQEDLYALKAKLQDNGYPGSVMGKGGRKSLSSTLPTTRSLTLSVPYNNRKVQSYQRAVRKLGVRPVFKRKRNVGEILGKRGKTKGTRNNNVVYKLSCECGEFYIGETGRDLQIRMSEHKRDVIKEKESSGVAQHVKRTGHKIDFDNVKIIDRESNTPKRRLREAYHIRTLKAKLNLYPGATISSIW